MDTSVLKMKKRRTTPDEKRQMVELADKGYSYASIGEAMNYSGLTVYRVVTKHRTANPVPAPVKRVVPAQKKKKHTKSAVFPLSETQKAMALDMWNNKHWNAAVIAKELKTTTASVKAYIKVEPLAVAS